MPKRTLRILMMSGIFYPKVDGSVIAVSNLIKCLRQRGHALYLITRKLPKTPHVDMWEGVPVVRVGPSNPSLIYRLMLSLNQARAGISILRTKKIDVIHAHGACSLLAALLLGKLFHRPVVATFHGFQRLWLKSVRWKGGISLTLSYPFEKLLANLADAVTAQSHSLKRVIIQLYKIPSENVWVIPHAINEGLFNYAPSPEHREPTVLFVGSLSRVHGPDLLIKVAPKILRGMPQTKFFLVGKGPRKEYLQRLIKKLNLQNSVFLVGPVIDREKLAKYYAAASVVVVPLKYRGYILSLVALEAMSTGRPVVTTMSLDPELRQFGVYAVGFDRDNFAESIKKILLLDREEYQAITRSARRYVEEQCSYRAVSSELEHMYTQLMRL